MQGRTARVGRVPLAHILCGRYLTRRNQERAAEYEAGYYDAMTSHEAGGT
jgi:hypothetical protein